MTIGGNSHARSTADVGTARFFARRRFSLVGIVAALGLAAVGSWLIFGEAASTGSAQPSSASTPVPTGCLPPVFGPTRNSLWISVCGPSRVIRNTRNSYGVAVMNFGKARFRTLRLSLIHYDPITASSV